MKYGIHWFRRDLRIAGNIALKSNWKKHGGKVLGLFCFDKKFLARNDFSVNRFQFFIKTLCSLKEELLASGSDLLILDIGPFEAFPELFQKMTQNNIHLPNMITWSRDYEPFARRRDEEMSTLFSTFGINTETSRDHLLIEPHELYKVGGDGYQVYSPFARKWLEIFNQKEFQKRIEEQKSGLKYLNKLKREKIEGNFSLTWKKLFNGHINYPDTLNHYQKENAKKVSIPIPEAGSQAVIGALEAFKKKLNNYQELRDFPADGATSKFSIFIKNGSLTVPQIIAYYDLKPYRKKKNAQDTFFSELIWREFYYHILYRHPHVETTTFLEKYKNLKWQNNKKWFEAWKEGRTGYPIVDAGMRELKTTGWMHNRVRMIVASFLAKDLLIDWRWGEKHFMDQLLDGDLAPNNGGWQWAASTGCDPQPYFRVFNPWLQSKKFDPEGSYIKKFIPELENLDSKRLHEPITDQKSYPKPIVDHYEQRDKALAMYKAD